jgi:hypothetical protein
MNSTYVQGMACTVSVLSLDHSPSPSSFAGLVSRVESKQIQLTSSCPIRPLQPIAVQSDDKLFLGEVLTCVMGPSGGEWNILMKIDQIITALQSLLKLRQELGVLAPSPGIAGSQNCTLAA